MNAPIIFDAMTFLNKPKLRLDQRMSFLYEWEATLKDEAAPQSALTIEDLRFQEAISRRRASKYIVVDIESISDHIEDQHVIERYLDLAKAAAPESYIAWWNTGPYEAFWNVGRTSTVGVHRDVNWRKWSRAYEKRKRMMDACDFGIAAMYFQPTDTDLTAWIARNMPRIIEGRRAWGYKPFFAAVAPHYFGAHPWAHVPGELFGAALDKLAGAGVDGIILWSGEGAGLTQTWNSEWPWVSALCERIGPSGYYAAPEGDA